MLATMYGLEVVERRAKDLRNGIWTRRNALLALFIVLTIVFAAISVIESRRAAPSVIPQSTSEPCFQSAFPGQLIVRVVSDVSGEPIGGASVTAMILNYCQTPAFPLETVSTNSTGYAMIPSDWVGNYDVVVAYDGYLYTFIASTGFSIDVATLSVPSGVSNVTAIACTDFVSTPPCG